MIYYLLVKVHLSKLHGLLCLKKMLFQYGFGNVWFEQHVFNESKFIYAFEQRIKDIYLQEWNSDVNSTSDFRLYKKIKHKFKFENYLHMDNKLFRIAITKVILSSHLFNIERGRWAKPKIEANDHKCNHCNVLEDEYHCLIECPRFTNVRRSCLPTRLKDTPSMFEFVNFMKCLNEDMYNKTGLLCFKVMKDYKSEYLVE